MRAWSTPPPPSRSPRPHERARHGREWPRRQSRRRGPRRARRAGARAGTAGESRRRAAARGGRSEEHTSELQSPCNLVCRLLLEKKKKDVFCLIQKRTRLHTRHDSDVELVVSLIRA